MSKLEVPKRIKSLVFEPEEIGGILIKNRLVRSATYEGMASEDGSVTDELVELYKILAEGEVGLIITGYAYVQPSGKAVPHQTGIDRDDLIPGLKKSQKQSMNMAMVAKLRYNWFIVVVNPLS